MMYPKAPCFQQQKQGEAWSAAKEVTSINGNYMVKHPCVGEIYAKEALFFSSNMEGGQGENDAATWPACCRELLSVPRRSGLTRG